MRFLSCEPLLGPVNVREMLMEGDNPGKCTNCGSVHGFTRCPNYGGVARHHVADSLGPACDGFRRAEFAIHWVIVGGESGPQARPCDVEWIRDIVRQCREAGVPCFVKQLGARPFYEHGGYQQWAHMKHRKGGEWNEWPEDLRVREFPA